jgi:methionine-rich copper-binding protein CopC
MIVLRALLVSLLCTLAALFTLAAPAFAHTRLMDSLPADGAVLESSPTRVMLRFSTAVRVVRLALVDAAGNPVELPGPNTGDPATELDVELPELPAGDYALSWVGMGSDTHKVSGTLRFSVAAGQ